jgi:hypothetical protein
MNQAPASTVAERLRAYMRERNLNVTELGALVYGHDDRGKPKGSGSICQLLTGKATLGWHRAELFREKLGLDLIDLVNPMLPRRMLNDWREAPASAAVLAYEEANGATMSSSPPKAPPLFMMQIGADGRGRLALHLMDRPAAEIVRAAQALQAAGLIEPDMPAEEAADVSCP